MQSFYEAQDWLEGLASEGKFWAAPKKPALDKVHAMLDALGRPDRIPAWRIIIGGSAGKGSACLTLEKRLLEHGKTVATLISPHIQTVTERMRVGGRFISEDAFARVMTKIREVAERENISVSYYEACVLGGIVFAAEQEVEYLIMEVGLGGEWDAVNAVAGDRISVVTCVGLDHTEILGKTLPEIARTKAGIFTADTRLALTYDQEMYSELQKKCPIELTLLKGIKQKMNTKIARNILQFVGIGTDVMTHEKVPMPARFEKLSERVWIDGAHSPMRFAFLAPRIASLPSPRTAVVALARHHEYEGMEVLLEHFDQVIWTEVPGDRKFWSPEALREHFHRGEVVADPLDALKLAQSKEGITVVFGSFFLCGAIRETFYAAEDMRAQQTYWPSRT